MAGLVPPATATKTETSTPKPKEEEKVDYMNLPCPIPYEEIHREALSLYPTYFFLLTIMLEISINFVLFFLFFILFIEIYCFYGCSRSGYS